MTLFNLQRFADDEVDNQVESIKEDNQDPVVEEEKKYTDKELDDIITKKFAKFAKEKEEAVEAAKKEAEKLAKMNAEQKQAYALEKLQRENEELKAQQARIALEKEAGKLLSEKGLATSDGVLGLVVASTAEQTQANIESLEAVINEAIQRHELERNKGKTPQSTSSAMPQLDAFQQRLAKYTGGK